MSKRGSSRGRFTACNSEEWLAHRGSVGRVLLGLVGGALPAALVLWPLVRQLSQAVPFGMIGVLLLGYLLVGVGCTLAAAVFALRRPLLDALRA